MRERQQRLVAFLSGERNWMRGSELAAALGVSIRTVQLEVARINKQKELPTIESNRRLGYRLRTPALQLVPLDQSHTEELFGEPLSYLFECQIIMVLLFEREWITLAEVAGRLSVARSTVVASMPRVRRIVLRTPGTNLVSRTGHGVRIEADEHASRAMLMKMLGVRFDAQLFYGLGPFDGIQHDVEELQSILAALLLRAHMWYTEVSLRSLVSYIAISILRSCYGFTLSGAHAYPNNSFVSSLTAAVEHWCGYQLSASECMQIVELVNGASLIPSESLDFSSSPWARAAVANFEKAVRVSCAISFSLDDEVRAALVQHLDCLRVRLAAGMTNIGRGTNDLLCRYPLAVHILRTCLDPILGERIPDAELGYLIPYLSEAIEHQRLALRLLLVSDRSAGSILRLRRALVAAAGGIRVEVSCLPSYALIYSSSLRGTNGDKSVAQLESPFDAQFTTEPRLALTNHNMTLLSPEFLQQTSLLLRKHIQEVWETVCLERNARMALRFPVQPLRIASDPEFLCACAQENQMALAQILGLYGFIEPHGISLEALDPQLLCVLAHTSIKTGASMVARSVCESFVYRDKRINEIAVIVFAHDVAIVEFFSYVRTLLA